MMFREWVQRFVSSKYTQALEAEVARLRAENRALLNSILGIAGVPPIVVARVDHESEWDEHAGYEHGGDEDIEARPKNRTEQ